MPSLFSINSTAPQLLTFLIQRIPDRNHTIFCLYFYLFCMFKQPAQAAVLVPLRIRVVRRHIRGKEHIAQQCVDCGKGAFLLCRQLAVFLPEEEPLSCRRNSVLLMACFVDTRSRWNRRIYHTSSQSSPTSQLTRQ